MSKGLYDSICSDKNVIYSHNNKFIFRISTEQIINRLKTINEYICSQPEWWEGQKKTKTDVINMLNTLKENTKVKISDELINNCIYIIQVNLLIL